MTDWSTYVPSAEEVLRFIDFFAGQENTPEEVRDFAQIAARYVDEDRPFPIWAADDVTSGFASWLREERFGY